MKIHLLYDTVLDGNDAQTIHTVELFENLRKIGNEIVIFIPRSKRVTINKQLGMIVLPMLNVRLMREISYQICLFLYYMLYQIKHTKPHVIYSRISMFTISPLILSKLFRIPYVVEINGLMTDEMKLSNTSKLIIQVSKIVEKFNYKYAKKIVVVNQGIKEGIIKLYNIPNEKIIVINNGANIDIFQPMNSENIKKELNLDKNYNYVGFSGSFKPWHGIESIVKSAPFILDKVENTKFLLVGDGEIKREIIKMVNDLNIEEHFIFIDRVSYDNVPRYINAFDVCVILKKKDILGSPLKLWEYMACGKPVVATRTEDFAILAENNAGLLVNPENLQELANAIIKLLQNLELMRRMGENGRKYVAENQSWESVAKRVAEVCESAIREYKK